MAHLYPSVDVPIVPVPAPGSGVDKEKVTVLSK